MNLWKTENVCMLSHFSRVRLFANLWTVAQVPLSMDSPGKNPRVGCLALLQGIFLTQGANPCLSCLLHWQASSWATLVAQLVKILPAMRETWVGSLGWEDPLEEGMSTSTPAFLPGEFHRQRILAGYSPWGHGQTRFSN